jgi:hypothetical protein
MQGLIATSPYKKPEYDRTLLLSPDTVEHSCTHVPPLRQFLASMLK